ncbi:diguanylate cyclase domain-containing protein [Kribbella sp. NPDC050124]|uniref:diguanylate cyclase domain-containing protein n=1 Tax=Kribbella sp. NPDC050124 TaxID=3364114 RepID=UPI00379C1E7F
MSTPAKLSSHQTPPALAIDAPHDRFPPATVGGWCDDARDDPITGLVAWPGFFTRLPRLIANAIGRGDSVGMAIGDVDNLKEYVEGAKAVDAQSFGHLAGNAFMGRLGTLARNWLWDSDATQACLATFGGDEIVFVSAATDETRFFSQVDGLRNQLCAGLPRTVSFGAGLITPTAIPESVIGDHWWREFLIHVIGAVEHRLFSQKHARRRGESVAYGFVAPTPKISRRR